MSESEDGRVELRDQIADRPWRYLALGVFLLILGLLGLSSARVTTVTSFFVLGPLLLLGGVFHLVHALAWRDRFAVAYNTPIGLLELAAGLVIVSDPMLRLRTFSWVIAVFFVASGLYRIAFAAAVRFPAWGWHVASGIVTVGLGVATRFEWPRSSMAALGANLSIYFMAYGWAFVMLWWAARSLAGGRPPRPARPVPKPSA
jgi:uncharacterized membrane protein HdeD (DUF308 family)